MMRLTLLAAALCASGSVHAAAQDCAAIADPAARLACYDTEHGKAPPAPAPAVPAAPATPAAPAVAPVDDFGMEQPRPVQPVKSITAHIVGTVTGWRRGKLFKLDNGQVWKVTDDDSRTYTGIPENPEVVISESAFGAFWMDILAVNARVKVKRVS
jgi:hypothetical protein